MAVLKQRSRAVSESNSEGELSRTVVFTLLSNIRRRNVLKCLEQDDRIRVRDLAERIASWENGIERYEVSYTQRKRVYTSLYQNHLPKLEEYDVVEYDRNGGVVKRGSNADQLETYLHGADAGAPSWQVSCGTLAVAGIVLGGGALLDAPLLGALPAGSIALGVSFALFALVAAHYRTEADS